MRYRWFLFGFTVCSLLNMLGTVPAEMKSNIGEWLALFGFGHRDISGAYILMLVAFLVISMVGLFALPHVKWPQRSPSPHIRGNGQ